MPSKKRLTGEQIVNKLREAEVLLSQGKTLEEVFKALEISKQTYYRWRKEYGGLNTTQAKKLKELEKENAGLRQQYADDISIRVENDALRKLMGLELRSEHDNLVGFKEFGGSASLTSPSSAGIWSAGSTSTSCRISAIKLYRLRPGTA